MFKICHFRLNIQEFFVYLVIPVGYVTMSYTSSVCATLIISAQDGKRTVNQWEAAPERDEFLADPPPGLWAHLDGIVQCSSGVSCLAQLAPPN